MNAPVVVVGEFMEEPALAPLQEAYALLYDPSLVDDRARLLQTLPHARALIVRNRTRVDAELLAVAPRLQVVGRLGVGLDNIDLKACRERNIGVYPATGANAVAVAEYVIAAALILRRGAFHANAAVVAGQWPRNSLVGGELAGQTLGLWGFGDIARRVAARARALEMTVVAHDPYLAPDDAVWRGAERLVDVRDLWRQSDVLSLHLPLTPETHRLVNGEVLAALKPETLLINTARGGIVDENALIEALAQGRLGGAALDVFEAEPLSAAAAAPFEGLPNVILTPHIAGATKEANQRVSQLTVANVLAALEATHG